jgi:hypothetical protein
VKIVFLLRHAGFMRTFESTLRLLCERGHIVHVGLLITKDRHWMIDSTNLGERLAGEYSNFSYGRVPVREDGWALLGARLRASSDYLRYLTPLYQDAPKLRERAADDVLPFVLGLLRRGPFTTAAGRSLVSASCRFLERCIPLSAEIDRFVAGHRPDLVLVSPLIEQDTPQREYVRAARARGIRTILCVASWDNLTNKGLIHGPMDLVTVWNDAMKREAVELHGLPPDRVVVTGAQVFDDWFTWQSRTSREAFCARIGLDPREPYFLYLCSSRFIAPDEASFVRTWIRELRQSASALLRSAGVLVRPHPQYEEQWRRFDASDLTNVTVFPPAGAVPVDDATKADYFDSIYHSAAVVGINTTAQIESAIVGRQVYTFLAPEFRDTQEGTLHFRHLLRAGGGFLQIATTFPDHLAQLDAALRNGSGDNSRCQRFVEAFVRPFGLDVPGTPKLVEAIETAPTRARIGGRVMSPGAALVRPALRPLAERLLHEESVKVAAKMAERLQKRQAARERKRQERAPLRGRGAM